MASLPGSDAPWRLEEACEVLRALKLEPQPTSSAILIALSAKLVSTAWHNEKSIAGLTAKLEDPHDIDAYAELAGWWVGAVSYGVGALDAFVQGLTSLGCFSLGLGIVGFIIPAFIYQRRLWARNDLEVEYDRCLKLGTLIDEIAAMIGVPAPVQMISPNRPRPFVGLTS